MFVPREDVRIEHFETKNELYSVKLADGKVVGVGYRVKGCGAVDHDYRMHHSKEGIVSVDTFLESHAVFGYYEKSLSEIPPLIRFLLTADPDKVRKKIEYFQRKEKN